MGRETAQKLNVPPMKDVDFEVQWPKQQLHFFPQSYYNSQTRLYFDLFGLIDYHIKFIEQGPS